MSWEHVLFLMLTIMPPRQNDRARLHEMAAVAAVISQETTTAADAAALIAIGRMESGFVIGAIGPLQEWSVWQIHGQSRHERDWIRSLTLRGQAREALRRLHQQGWAGFTGEANARQHPLADHRRALAEKLLAL